ncbi:MAG TPA: toll/interleukin-1 receptor domain-containing protein [Solimonas sp.]|nr:toll/interleukin-1 receptor domain-containing protein [Solimonas sp.]
MQLLEEFSVRRSRIQLYHGDLAAIPPAEAVDLLVVSAFPDDYAPTPSSLIGALALRGVSVAALAADKEADLRDNFSCWLSRDLSGQYPDLGFRRILCFEPQVRGRPPEVVGDVFRALMPFALAETPTRSIAMPVLAAGDQRYDSEVMLAALLEAAVHWLEHGLPIETIKIVAHSASSVPRLRKTFTRLRPRSVRFPARNGLPGKGLLSADVPTAPPPPGYDFFVSYSRIDAPEVDQLVQGLKNAAPGARVFQDKLELKPGDSWQAELDEALESCRKVVAIYSPAYLQSKVCMEEFNMARLRHRETDSGVLLPVYLRTAQLPLYMRSLHFLDCREGDVMKLGEACGKLASGLP